MKQLVNIYTLVELFKRALYRSKSGDKLAYYQLQKFQEITAFAYNENPFYKQKYDSTGFHPKQLKSIEDISLIPSLTKQEARELVESLELKSDYFIDQTSGSTSTPIKFYRTTKEKAYLNSKYLFALFKIGYHPLLKTFSIPNSFQKVKRDSFIQQLGLFRRVTVSIDEGIDKIATGYIKARPHFLYGYKSQLLQLGKILEEKEIQIPFPKLFVVAGEHVDKHSELLLKKYFGNNMHKVYGSIEFNNIAYQKNTNDDYTLNQECTFVEEIKYQEKSSGEFYITDFFLKTIPLIRYQIGDAGNLIHENGQAIKEITGKVENKIQTSKHSWDDYEIIAIFNSIDGIARFQFTQTLEDTFLIQIVATKADTNQLEKEIIIKFQEKLGEFCTFKVQFEKEITPDKNGKLRLIKPLNQ